MYELQVDRVIPCTLLYFIWARKYVSVLFLAMDTYQQPRLSTFPTIPGLHKAELPPTFYRDYTIQESELLERIRLLASHACTTYYGYMHLSFHTTRSSHHA